MFTNGDAFLLGMLNGLADLRAEKQTEALREALQGPKPFIPTDARMHFEDDRRNRIAWYQSERGYTLPAAIAKVGEEERTGVVTAASKARVAAAVRKYRWSIFARGLTMAFWFALLSGVVSFVWVAINLDTPAYVLRQMMNATFVYVPVIAFILGLVSGRRNVRRKAQYGRL